MTALHLIWTSPANVSFCPDLNFLSLKFFIMNKELDVCFSVLKAPGFWRIQLKIVSFDGLC